MKLEQPKSPEPLVDQYGRAISWEKFHEGRKKFEEEADRWVREKQEEIGVPYPKAPRAPKEKPNPPKSPHDDSSISWEQYSSDRRGYEEDMRWWIRETEKPYNAREALDLLVSGGPMSETTRERWTYKVYIYTPSGRYLTDREMEFSKLKYLLEDLSQSNLQFYLTDAHRSTLPEQEKK